MAFAKSNGNNQNRKIKVQNQKRTLWGVSPNILYKKSFLKRNRYTAFSGCRLILALNMGTKEKTVNGKT